ncbi:MAG: hypothetical protein CMM91_05420 [Rickettsiales bacterium]|nr:hypothetical protein [Rickettsiales bacterium]OUV53515.1 MAG: hypothetical protein CBC87_04155 [Rickettsiales bacterium TMED127]|tara:strand:- start:63 stop:482 length:420 start_codon:yes stop_codon:yes gene_type:complete
MATRKIKFKHIAESATVHVGDAGELILDTSTNTLKVSDGSTAGGVTLTTDGGGSTGDIVFSGNKITTNSSNADLQLDANGTGKITTTAQLQPYRFLVPRFATESAANSAYGTKVGGELIYTTGDNQLRVWNGSVWSSVM